MKHKRFSLFRIFESSTHTIFGTVLPDIQCGLNELAALYFLKTRCWRKNDDFGKTTMHRRRQNKKTRGAKTLVSRSLPIESPLSNNEGVKGDMIS